MPIPPDEQLAAADNPFTEQDEDQPAVRDLLDKFASLNEEAQLHPHSDGEDGSSDEEGEGGPAADGVEGAGSSADKKKKKKKKKSKAAKAVQKLKFV
jgi:glycylpeptide N-tetradecanoyltransferase